MVLKITIFFGFIFPFIGFGQNCEKLLSKMEAAFESSENPKAIIRQYEKECFIVECNDICAFDAIKVRYYRTSNNLEKGIQYAENALKKNGSQNFRAKVLAEEAIIYYIQGNYLRSIEFAHQAISDKKIDKNTIAKAYSILANSHWQLGNDFYADQYFSKCYIESVLIKDSTLIAFALNGKGLVRYGKGDERNIRNALIFFKNSLKYAANEKTETKVATKNNLAAAHLALEEYDSAEVYLKHGLQFYLQSSNVEGQISAYANLGSLYLQMDQIELAKTYIEKGLEIHQLTFPDQKTPSGLLLSLSDLYYKLGDYKKSRDFYEEYSTQSLDLLNADRNQAVIEMQERYDALNKENEIIDLRSTAQRSELVRLRLQNTITLILIAFVLASLLVVYLAFRKRKNDKAKKSAELYRASLEAAENEKLRFSRDLHDSMGGTLTLMSLMLSQQKDNDPDNLILDNLQKTTANAIQELRRICRDLYPEHMTISGLESSITSYIDNLNSSQVEIRFYSKLNMPEFSAGFNINLYRIVQELTNNTMKYSAASEADFEAIVDKNQLKLTYWDNGIGIDLKNLKKGVGLNSIEERIRSYNGKFEIISNLNEGFKINMTFELENII